MCSAHSLRCTVELGDTQQGIPHIFLFEGYSARCNVVSSSGFPLFIRIYRIIFICRYGDVWGVVSLLFPWWKKRRKTDGNLLLPKDCFPKAVPWILFFWEKQKEIKCRNIFFLTVRHCPFYIWHWIYQYHYVTEITFSKKLFSLSSYFIFSLLQYIYFLFNHLVSAFTVQEHYLYFLPWKSWHGIPWRSVKLYKHALSEVFFSWLCETLWDWDGIY